MANFCDRCARRLPAGDSGCPCGTSIPLRSGEPDWSAIAATDPPAAPFDPQQRIAGRSLVAVLVGVAAVAVLVTLIRLGGADAGSPAGQQLSAGSGNGYTPYGGVTSRSTVAGTGSAEVAVGANRPGPANPTATASCTSAPGQDSAGNPFTYEPDKAIDGRPDTAWRCDHDGAGQTLTIRFPGTVSVRKIGIVPGFAKTDPYDGTDRYPQGRRISAVRYSFDDGSEIPQQLNVDPSFRGVQSVTFQPKNTTGVTITILASVPGIPTNGFGPVDKIAISEVAFE